MQSRRVEAIVLKDHLGEAFEALEKEELRHAAVADHVGEVGEAVLGHGVIADEAADAGVALHHRQGAVPGAKEMHHAAGGDGVGDGIGGSADVVHLRLANASVNLLGLREPLLGRHQAVSSPIGF